MTNNLAVKWAEPAPRFSYPEKERAVVGYLAMRGFDGVPASAVVQPEAFASDVGGVFYAAAYGLHKTGRPVGHISMLDAVERNRHWLELVTVAAGREGMADWKDYLIGADDSLGYNPMGGQMVGEMLGEIAEALARRRAVEIGKGLMDGSVAPGDAVRALEASLPAKRLVERHSIRELFKFEPKADPGTLLGNRWVCKGGQLLLVGQSGVGKSSLTVQAAMTWALGLPFFGIKPARALKSLYIQAENDEGDMAEIVQGGMSYVVAKSGLAADEEIGRAHV